VLKRGYVVSTNDWKIDIDDGEILTMLEYGPFVVPNGNYWILYGINEGAVRWKARMAFHDDPLEPDRPELIDVKITNVCQHGCPFCAEDSRPEGAHADKFLWMLETLPIGTEVTIGGGNPLLFPDLADVLKKLTYSSCFTSVTIRDLDATAENMLLPNRNWGISLTPGVDRSGLLRLMQENELPYPQFGQITLHAILGVNSLDEVRLDLPPLSRYNVLFLGYKTKGRGATFKPSVPVPTFEECEALAHDVPSISSVAFDHLALHQLGMDEAQVETEFPLQYGGSEGEFSIYVDLVRGVVRRSSFGGPEVPVIGCQPDWWRRYWNEVRPRK